MAVSAQRSGTTVTLLVEGDLDVAALDQPVTHLRRHLGPQHVEWVVVDVAAVGFVDSSGLGALIRVQQEARRYGARTRLVGVGPRLHQLLQLTGLDREFLGPGPRQQRDAASRDRPDGRRG